MYDIERCSWFSGSRITAQNANYNTHPNVIPLQYFVIMFMQFYLFFISNERLSVVYQGFRTLTHTLTDGSETFWYVYHIKTHVYIWIICMCIYDDVLCGYMFMLILSIHSHLMYNNNFNSAPLKKIINLTLTKHFTKKFCPGFNKCTYFQISCVWIKL